jgi:hypothetical protein
MTDDGRYLFRASLADLESNIIALAEQDWKKPYGRFKPKGGEFGRTTILPPLFADVNGAQMVHWRQNFTSTGSQLILSGVGTGYTIPEGFKVAWAGLAFPNKEMTITELKWQIGDTKYGRANIEEMRGYNQPALVFKKGFIIDEEEAFELTAYVEETGYQRIVPLGFQLNKEITKVLGAVGSAIPHD